MNNILKSSVFIVDDDPFTCLLYKKKLHVLGFTDISYFLCGVDCLDNLHLNPEIILLDHQMDQINGFEILKKIKRQSPNAAVIMVSGQQDMATALDSLKYGAFDYIIKDSTETERIEDTLSRLAKLKQSQPNSSLSLFRKLLSIR